MYKKNHTQLKAQHVSQIKKETALQTISKKKRNPNETLHLVRSSSRCVILLVGQSC